MVLKYVRYDSWNDIYILVWIKNDLHVSSNFFFIKNLKKFRYFLKNFQFLSFIFSIWTWVCVLTAREYSLHIRLVIQCLSWAFLCMNFTLHEFHCRRVIKFQKWLINSKNQNCPHSSASPCGHAICNIKCSKKLVVNSRFSRRYNDIFQPKVSQYNFTLFVTHMKSFFDTPLNLCFGLRGWHPIKAIKNQNRHT